MSSELARYGIAPTRWSIDEERGSLYLWTDLSVIELTLSVQQIAEFKAYCAFLCNHYGRKWQDGMLCIPAREQKRGQNDERTS